MSHPSLRRLRVLAAASLVVAALPATASASPYGQEEFYEADYSCKFPLLPAESVALTSSSTYWQAIPTGSRYPGGAEFTGALTQIGTQLRQARAATATFNGSWRWRITSPSGKTSVEDVALAPKTFSLETSPVLSIGAPAPAPQRVFDEQGEWSFELETLSYAVDAKTVTGDPVDLSPQDEGTTGTLACSGPGLGVAGTRVIWSNAPKKPVVDRVETTPTSATLILANVGGNSVESYRVLDVDRNRDLAQVNGPTQQIALSGLTPNTTYNVRVSAYALWETSPLSDVVTFTTPSSDRPVELSASGTVTLRSPLSGSAAIRGGLSGKVDAGGGFTGAATFAPATATFKAFGGLIPVRATLGFTPSGDATGTEVGSSFTLATKQDIAIKNATFAGVKVSVGTCHTATPPTITLKSTGSADLTAGGAASGTFTLGRLTGCSTLGSLVGTNGGATTLSVKFQPVPASAS